MTDCSGFSTASNQALAVKDKEILVMKAPKDEEVNALKKQMAEMAEDLRIKNLT